MPIEKRIDVEAHNTETVILDYVRAQLVPGGVKVEIKSKLLADWVKATAKPMEVANGTYLKLAKLPMDWEWPLTVNTEVFSASNIFWLTHKDLGEGAEIQFDCPVLLPADIIDYVNGTCDIVSRLYNKYLRKSAVCGRVIKT